MVEREASIEQFEGKKKLDNDCSSDSTDDEQSINDDEENQTIIRQHSSYEQVMLDVRRCAGRLKPLGGPVYLHRTDDDDEPPEDLTDELQRLTIDSSDSSEILAQEIINSNSASSSSACKDNDDDDDHDKVTTFKSQRELKRKLAQLIVKLLIKKKDLHYYQGFHDVCLTYMTLLGYQSATKKLDQLIDSHFRIFMQPTMEETQDFLALIPIIIGSKDQELNRFLERSEVGTIFALSWVITWFSHVIPSELDVQQIFRFLEARDPHMVLYLSAAIVLRKKTALFKLDAEMSTVHHYLCQVPRKEKLPLSELLEEATRLFVKWPPELIRQKLDKQKRARLRVQNYNILSTLTSRLPIITNIVTSNTKLTAVFVLVLSAAIALQFDRWSR